MLDINEKVEKAFEIQILIALAASKGKLRSVYLLSDKLRVVLMEMSHAAIESDRLLRKANKDLSIKKYSGWITNSMYFDAIGKTEYLKKLTKGLNEFTCDEIDEALNFIRNKKKLAESAIMIKGIKNINKSKVN